MSSKTCKQCGSSEIEVDQARGDAVCTNCGSVLEENIIVSEVQFEENASGGTSALGQFVSNDGKSMSRSFTDSLHTGYKRESRAITLENGRRTIVEVAQQLRLNQHCIDTAFNFFKMAVHKRMTQGRRHGNVVAACLYIVCRTEGTSHMLLDFCDVLQTNVYELGKTYLRLSTALCINIPAIDPCLYIMRFAHRLQFGDKTHEVSMTAMRLLQRMKRDWIHTGRRPAGVCGAALLVAARMHEFNRTLKDIIKVVKVCTATVRKRLNEFGDTPSGQLTLDDFMTIDLEEEQDPPAFKASRLKARLQQLEESKGEEATEKINEFYCEIERHLERKKRMTAITLEMQAAAVATTHDGVLEVDANQEARDALQFMELETIGTIENFVNGSSSTPPPDASVSPPPCASTTTTTATVMPWASPVAGCSSSSMDWRSPIRGLGPTAASLGLKDSIEECLKVNETEIPTDDGELDLTGIDDSELDGYIMTADEAMRKSNLWHVVNADYLKEQKEKEEREAKQREEDAGKPEKMKRKPRRKPGKPTLANTAGEAIEKMLQEKKISSKINYDVLRSLSIGFDTPSNASASTATPSRVNATEVVATTEADVPVPSFGSPIVIDDALERRKLQESRLNAKGFSVPLTGILRTKRPISDDSVESETKEKKVKIEEKRVVEVVIENGPIVEESGNPELEADDDDYYDEDDTSLTAQLHRHSGYGGEDDNYNDDCDDYYD